jgi:hypothetical protein
MKNLNKINSASSPKIQTEFFSKKVEHMNPKRPTEKETIEDIMDPNKKKKENLKKFEMKMENKEKMIDELIINTIPGEGNSKKEIDAKTFFKNQIENKDGLTFETPVFGKASNGVFEFAMDVENLKEEDIFFKNKMKSPGESVRFKYLS